MKQWRLQISMPQPPECALAIIRHHGGEILECENAKSAQHTVWIVSVQPRQNPNWKTSLDRGGNRLVVRQWRGQCRWWNLNHPMPDETIAEHEIWGYQTARDALEAVIRIPHVLHHGETDQQQEFAILEYVGDGSTLFSNERPIDTSWTDSMVKIRHEFGFDEPHPRWGRVPVEQSIDYAMLVLNQIVLPLHKNCVRHNDMPVMTFERIVEMQTSKFYNSIAPHIGADIKMRSAATTLKVALQAGHDIPRALPPVLVHLDLQPQNILFGRGLNTVPQIVSVLDWEEAAWADPRFELLLIGRKVCANRDQAEAVWTYYQEQTGVSLGSITPWLRLETLHSLTTLLLQATTGTGRSPWEAKPDLWGKIEREMVRLDGYNDS